MPSDDAGESCGLGYAGAVFDIRPDEGFAIMAATNIERLTSDTDVDGDGDIDPRGPRAVGEAMKMLMDHQTACPDYPDTRQSNGLAGAGLGGASGPLLGRTNSEASAEVMVFSPIVAERESGRGLLSVLDDRDAAAFLCPDAEVFSQSAFEERIVRDDRFDWGACVPADELEIRGVARGGGVEVIADGVRVWVLQQGATAEAIAEELAEAMNLGRDRGEPLTKGFEVIARDGRLITPGFFENIDAGDDGMHFVPEPGFMSLLGFGLGGLVLLVGRGGHRDR